MSLIYCLKTFDAHCDIWVESQKQYNEKELKKLLSLIRFELSHHAKFDDVLNILCREYNFKVIKPLLIKN